MAGHEELIAALAAQAQPVNAEETMAEAGRKILLADFIKMLENETGSREGGDIEHVHDMRVATRRMRSALRLLNEFFQPKAVRAIERPLRRTARALGTVRDLDVMIDSLEKAKEGLEPTAQEALSAMIERLDGERVTARHALNRVLDKGEYRHFVDDFARFVSTPGMGARKVDIESHVPWQVRHLLPIFIYQHVAQVRAYDTVLEEADALTLHALRIEIKRLRYVVTFFSDVLGASISDFISELKGLQDHLGTMNDLHVAYLRLSEMAHELDEEHQQAIGDYLEGMEAESQAMRGQVGAIWRRFNGKTVQRQLAKAVADL